MAERQKRRIGGRAKSKKVTRDRQGGRVEEVEEADKAEVAEEVENEYD